MDDILLFGEDRDALAEVGRAIEDACARQRLRLHPWEVRSTRTGVGWLGFRILPREVRVKRSSVARAQRRLRRERAKSVAASPRLSASVRSTFAHWARRVSGAGGRDSLVAAAGPWLM